MAESTSDLHDPKDMEVEGVTFTSESADELEASLDANERHNQIVARKWRERVQSEGTPKWAIPFERGHGRRLFDSEDACLDVMINDYAAQMEQARLEGKPDAAWTPQRVMVPPKPRPEDFMTPTQAKYAAKMDQLGDGLRGQMEDLNRAMLADNTSMLAVMAPDGMHEIDLTQMSDDQIVDACYRATMGGRMDRVRPLRKEADRRGLELEF